jgi:hypothetical protein
MSGSMAKCLNIRDALEKRGYCQAMMGLVLRNGVMVSPNLK